METPSRPFLAFDTSTPTARVAVLSPTGQSIAASEKTAARHSANLLGLCDDVLRAAGTRVADLSAIACGAGPGSFTGLRVGLAVAKGLALPTALPLVLVSSLEALALDLLAARPESDLLLPSIDAGKGQVYARLLAVTEGTAPRPLGQTDWVLPADELVALVIEQAVGRSLAAGGTGVDRFRPVFESALGAAVLPLVAGPSPCSLGRLALDRMSKGDFDAIETAVPRYGRPPDITRPKKSLLAKLAPRG